LVFLFPRSLSVVRERELLDVSLGFAGGVMLAASFWSLLTPALDYSTSDQQYGHWGWIPVAIGFILGALFVDAADRWLPKDQTDTIQILTHKKNEEADASQSNSNKNETTRVGITRTDGSGRNLTRRTRTNPQGDSDLSPLPSSPSPSFSFSSASSVRDRKQSWRRIFLLVIAIVIHNIPEGMAVGVGFGSLSLLPPDDLESASLNPNNPSEKYLKAFNSARMLSIGIGLQNFPEGLVVSLPLLRVGYSRMEAFFWGQLSGLVEPVGGIAGAALITVITPLLPYALSFAAGAMIYVVVEELIPETLVEGGNPKMANWGLIIGFVVMMALDVGLG